MEVYFEDDKEYIARALPHRNLVTVSRPWNLKVNNLYFVEVTHYFKDKYFDVVGDKLRFKPGFNLPVLREDEDGKPIPPTFNTLIGQSVLKVLAPNETKEIQHILEYNSIEWWWDIQFPFRSDWMGLIYSNSMYNTTSPKVRKQNFQTDEAYLNRHKVVHYMKGLSTYLQFEALLMMHHIIENVANPQFHLTVPFEDYVMIGYSWAGLESVDPRWEDAYDNDEDAIAYRQKEQASLDAFYVKAGWKFQDQVLAPSEVYLAPLEDPMKLQSVVAAAANGEKTITGYRYIMPMYFLKRLYLLLPLHLREYDVIVKLYPTVPDYFETRRFPVKPRGGKGELMDVEE